MNIIFEVSKDELKNMFDEAEVESIKELEEVLEEELRFPWGVYSESVKVWISVLE